MDPMQQVREGMHVVDANGKEIGKIEDFKMGDPAVVTATGARDITEADFLDAFGKRDDLSQHLAKRLLRLGYVKIDRKGLFRHDQLVGADQLDRVDDGKLFLKAGYKAATT